MIKITDLSFTYPQTTVPVLSNINLEIQPGTISLVAGASGSGKSTFLRCLNGLVPHFSGGTISGEIQVFGSDPIRQGPKALAKKVGFVFQDPEAQFVFDIVEDEIAFALENASIPRDEMIRRMDEILHQFQLTDIRKQKVQQISGGEMQKVAIASALVHQPQVLVFDEPTSQLDPPTAEDLMRYIVGLKQKFGLTILIAEHRLERLLPFVDSIIYLPNNGEVISGTPSKILPLMAQAPPIIKIAQALNLKPLPVTLEQIAPMIRSIPHKELILADDPQRGTHPVILSLHELSTSIDNRKILHEISFDLHEGEILTLLGSNGAGKTTLLRSILGLIPTSGEKHLFGQNFNQMQLTDLIQQIAYLPQNPNDLLFAESVYDELKVTLTNHHIQVSDTIIDKFLATFNLQDKQDLYPRDLSVGERQRTALAAITVHHPPILLVDEPTRGLDDSAKQKLAKVFKTWRDEGSSILLVTHDVEFAAGVADRVLILEKGHIVFSGNPKIAFTQFPAYQTQSSRLFPNTPWITPSDLDKFTQSANVNDA